jgi:BASS family bile acid:Na+ symporter
MWYFKYVCFFVKIGENILIWYLKRYFMTKLVVKIFPICAVIFSIFACVFPNTLNHLGFLIVPLLGFIMLCMGATLSTSDFAAAIKKPRAVIIGLVLQFLLMPLLACLIGKVLNLPKDQYIGLIMVGTVAGGTASNVIAYLAGGDVALSITMTACSTVAGIILTPLISSLYLGNTVEVQAFKMFKDILYMVGIPVALGLIINRIFRKQQAILNTICPIFSVVGIVFVIGIIMALNVATIRSCGILVFCAVALHNLTGLGFGFGVARLLKCDLKTSITIAIEVGMQNSGLATALSKQFFSIAAALPGAIFSVWHNISGALFAGFARKKLLK